MKPIVLGIALVSAVVLLCQVPSHSAESSPWVQMSGVPTTANLYAVTGVSRTRAWAAGERGTMLMWDGKSWHPQTMPDPNAGKAPSSAELLGTFINDIVMFNERDGWAVGHYIHRLGRIYRWNGQAWSLSATLHADESDLVNVAFLSPAEGRAIASHGRVYRFTNNAWEVALGPDHDAMALGQVEEGTRDIKHLEDVEAVPSINGYVLAGITKPQVVDNHTPAPEADSIVWLDPTYWVGVTARRTPGDRATSDIVEMFSLPDGTVYYLSSHKNILRTLDVAQKAFTPWTFSFQVEHGLRNFWMLNEGEGWFIGHAGLVSHLTIGTRGLTNTNTYPTTQRLTDIWMLDEDFGFIVGDNGTILQLNRQPELSLRPAAGSFRHRADVAFELVNTGGALVWELNGHWDITNAAGTRVKRISIPAGSLSAGRSLRLGWNQIDEQGRSVPWGTYTSTVRIGSYQAKAQFQIETPPSDTPDIVGANAGLALTAESTYAPTASVSFRLENIGSTAVDVGDATYTIERFVNGSWRPYYASPVSFLGAQTITPAMSRTWAWNRRSSSGNAVAPAGRYRIVVAVPRATTDRNIREFTLQ